MNLHILANENVPGEAVEAMRREGYNVAWIRADSPGSSDDIVLARAQAENRILVTFDKDFGELAFRWGLPASSGIILFRLKIPGSAYTTNLLLAVLRSRSDWKGHFAIVEDDRIRMVSLIQSRRENP